MLTTPLKHETDAPADTASARIARVVEASAARLGLDRSWLDRLLLPKEVIRMRISVKLSDERVHNLPAFIVRHSMLLGPAKGGVRLSVRVDDDIITALATEMTLKTSLIGVPFGGGKAGIQCDGRHLSAEDKERIIRGFANTARRHLGPELYVPAPDMGTDETDMGHLKDAITYGEGTATTRGCYVTGKPVLLGGVEGRRDATGFGVIVNLRSMLEQTGRSLDGMRVVVQGFGNVGAAAAAFAEQHGARVVAVSDISGAVADANGIRIDALCDHVKATGGVAGYPGASPLDPEALYETEAEVFIPAAIGGVLDADRAERLAAAIVVEAANGPTTPEGDRVLEQRRITILPDILANAGGVFVSYLEYTQETQREQWTLANVRDRLEKRLRHTFDTVWQHARSHHLTCRAAATDLALKRLQQAMYARGLLS